MRDYKHIICQSKSGKSIQFRIYIDDKYGKQSITFASVSGWRNKLALTHLLFETEEWNDDVRRKYVGLQVLRCSKNKFEAIEFINIVKSLSSLEIHFWASKFMTNQRSGKAWRMLYC